MIIRLATYFIQKSTDLATAEALPDVPVLLLHLYTNKQVETLKNSPSAEHMIQEEFTQYLKAAKQSRNKSMGEWARKNKLGFAGVLAYLDAGFHQLRKAYCLFPENVLLVVISISL